MLEKRKVIARPGRKTVYLLGADKDGILYWIEEASWNCGWYWVFGYVETYTNNAKPQISRDIQSHQHFDGFIGKQESYNLEKRCWQLSSNYVHHLNDEHSVFAETVLTDNESWQLSELMKRFYILKETAELFGRGGAYISEADENLKRPEIVKEINEVILPALFEEVYSLLSPKE